MYIGIIYWETVNTLLNIAVLFNGRVRLLYINHFIFFYQLFNILIFLKQIIYLMDLITVFFIIQAIT